MSLRPTNISTPLLSSSSSSSSSSKASFLSIYLSNLSKQIGTRVNPEFYEELQLILKRERNTYTKWMAEQILDYLKAHGSTKANYSLDEFVKNPDHVATPLFFDSLESWKNFLYHQDTIELNRLEYRLNELHTQLQKRRIQNE